MRREGSAMKRVLVRVALVTAFSLFFLGCFMGPGMGGVGPVVYGGGPRYIPVGGIYGPAGIYGHPYHLGVPRLVYPPGGYYGRPFYGPRPYGGWRGPGYFGRGGMYRWR